MLKTVGAIVRNTWEADGGSVQVGRKRGRNSCEGTMGTRVLERQWKARLTYFMAWLKARPGH